MNLPGDRHLDCFQIWSIINVATKNIYVQVFVHKYWNDVLFFIFLVRSLGLELLGHLELSVYSFMKLRKCFPK